jgi:hypothetical protein
MMVKVYKNIKMGYQMTYLNFLNCLLWSNLLGVVWANEGHLAPHCSVWPSNRRGFKDLWTK